MTEKERIRKDGNKEEPEEEHVDYVGFDLMMDRATKIMNAMAQRSNARD